MDLNGQCRNRSHSGWHLQAKNRGGGKEARDSRDSVGGTRVPPSFILQSSCWISVWFTLSPWSRPPAVPQGFQPKLLFSVLHLRPQAALCRIGMIMYLGHADQNVCLINYQSLRRIADVFVLCSHLIGYAQVRRAVNCFNSPLNGTHWTEIYAPFIKISNLLLLVASAVRRVASEGGAAIFNKLRQIAWTPVNYCYLLFSTPSAEICPVAAGQ